MNVVSSAAKVAALGKYLVALSTSMAKTGIQEKSDDGKLGETQIRRKQLHILYLMNDLLHQTKYHSKTSSLHLDVSKPLEPFLIDLFRAAAGYDPSCYIKQHRRVNELLEIWEKQDYYPASFTHNLHNELKGAGRNRSTGGKGFQGVNGSNHISEDEKRDKAEAPFMMPASHGDPSAPYYDLPAGNIMSQIIPNLPDPINPQFVKPLQFTPGPADASLVHALKDFLKSVDSLYGNRTSADEVMLVDIDEFGQSIYRDEATGETAEVGSYYGWSKAFCENMKRKKYGRPDMTRLRGRSGSSESSRSPRKRRRYSSSQSTRTRSRSGSRSRDTSYRRRSPERPPKFNRTRSRSRSSVRSRSPDGHSRSRSYSPPQRFPPQQQLPPPPLQNQHQFQSGSPPLPFPNPFPHGVPLGPDGLPIPPPPPPNYTGPWPPPPPPLGLNGTPIPPPGQFIPPPAPLQLPGQHQIYPTSRSGLMQNHGGVSFGISPPPDSTSNQGTWLNHGRGGHQGTSFYGQRGGQQYGGVGRGRGGWRG